MDRALWSAMGGPMTNPLRKRLGLNVQSAPVDGSTRVYRIVEA